MMSVSLLPARPPWKVFVMWARASVTPSRSSCGGCVSKRSMSNVPSALLIPATLPHRRYRAAAGPRGPPTRSRDQAVRASATSPRPIPIIQMSLPTATPAWLGHMLPGLRSAGVRAYMVMRLPENAVSAAPARAFGTTGAMRAVLTAILLPEAGLQIVYHGPVTVPTGPDGPDDPACPADVADPAGAALAAGACGSHRRLRVDAERNRAALLAAAREVFAEQGLEAPLEEVALRAGVGIATLYRRFPNRRQLVAAALVDTFAQYAEAAERALAVSDPWAGFAGFIERICELQAADRGLSDLLSMALPADERIEQLRRLANDRVVELIERTKAAGRLREEFVGEDILLLLIAHAAVLDATRQDAPNARRRFVALMLDAFQRRDGASLPAPPTTAQMTTAMLRLARERGCGNHK